MHLSLEGANLNEIMLKPFSLNFFEMIDRMRRTVEAGITTVRDAGGTDLGVKTAVERGHVLGPRMQLSITMLSITGGHGDGWMPSGMEVTLFPAYPGMPRNICDSIGGVRQKVREVLRAGAEVVKLCSTGGAVSPTDHPMYVQFSLGELKAAVEEAQARNGARVMAHAIAADGIKNAIRAGIHSIEHGIFMDDEAIEMMVANGTFLVPTLSAIVIGLEHAAKHNTLPQYAIDKAKGALDLQRENTRKAIAAGVKMAMGTDAGVFPHGLNLRELELMTELGMSPMDAIVATTKTAAECLGWEDQIGTLEAGKLADVVITSVDPLSNIGSLKEAANIKMVMKDGAVVKDIM